MRTRGARECIYLPGSRPKAVTVGDIALLYTEFEDTTVDASGQTGEARYKAIEVLRRQADGTWIIIMGDPGGRM